MLMTMTCIVTARRIECQRTCTPALTLHAPGDPLLLHGTGDVAGRSQVDYNACSAGIVNEPVKYARQ